MQIRDKMEAKLKLAPKGAFKTKNPERKLSCIPGTNKMMASGITLHTYWHQDSLSYDILVRWRDHTGKARVKTIYGCSETTYTRKVMKAAYDRALAFRKAYETAILVDTLEKLNPADFNKRRF
jgi:hypothetical protein